MAFTFTRTEDTVMGNKRVTMGTYSQGNGDTGGTIKTGVQGIKHFEATGATKATVSGDEVTFVTADPLGDMSGFWKATGDC